MTEAMKTWFALDITVDAEATEAIGELARHRGKVIERENMIAARRGDQVAVFTRRLHHVIAGRVDQPPQHLRCEALSSPLLTRPGDYRVRTERTQCCQDPQNNKPELVVTGDRQQLPQRLERATLLRRG